jgi:stress response protein SCP2
MMRLVVGLLLIVFLVAGCGQKDTTAMNHKFERLEYQISTLETINSSFNDQHFAKLTQQYIALVHEYQDTLGKDEARKRLTDMGDQLDSYCLPCTGVLYVEAKKL